MKRAIYGQETDFFKEIGTEFSKIPTCLSWSRSGKVGSIADRQPAP